MGRICGSLPLCLPQREFCGRQVRVFRFSRSGSVVARCVFGSPARILLCPFALLPFSLSSFPSRAKRAKIFFRKGLQTAGFLALHNCGMNPTPQPPPRVRGGGVKGGVRARGKSCNHPSAVQRRFSGIIEMYPFFSREREGGEGTGIPSAAWRLLEQLCGQLPQCQPQQELCGLSEREFGVSRSGSVVARCVLGSPASTLLYQS
jgi:hypothetical protein